MGPNKLSPRSFFEALRPATFRPNGPGAPVAPPKGAPGNGPDRFEAKGSAKPKLVLNPGELNASFKGEVGASGKFKGAGIDAQVKFDAAADASVKHENGFATFTLSASASATESGSVALKQFSVGASATQGANVQYQVRMRDADFDKLRRGEIPPPDPFNPQSLPDKASVQLDSGTFHGSTFQASFSELAASLRVGDSLKESHGTTIRLEANGNEVTATGGNTAAFEGSNTVGLSVGKLNVSVGSSSVDKQFQLQTATFDRSTPEGQAALARFGQDGRIPTTDQPGLKNVALIEKDLSSGSGGASISLGAFSLDGSTGSNHANNILVHHPDGSTDFHSDFDVQGIPTTIDRTLDKDGRIVPGSTRAQLTFDLPDPTSRRQLLGAFGGRSPEELDRLASQKGPIQVTLNQDQLKQLQVRAGQLINQTPESQQDLDFETLKLISDQKEFHQGTTRSESEAALAVGAFSGSPLQVADLLGRVMTGDGSRLQGEVQVLPG